MGSTVLCNFLHVKNFCNNSNSGWENYKTLKVLQKWTELLKTKCINNGMLPIVERRSRLWHCWQTTVKWLQRGTKTAKTTDKIKSMDKQATRQLATLAEHRQCQLTGIAFPIHKVGLVKIWTELTLHDLRETGTDISTLNVHTADIIHGCDMTFSESNLEPALRDKTGRRDRGQSSTKQQERKKKRGAVKSTLAGWVKINARRTEHRKTRTLCTLCYFYYGHFQCLIDGKPLKRGSGVIHSSQQTTCQASDRLWQGTVHSGRVKTV